MSDEIMLELSSVEQSSEIIVFGASGHAKVVIDIIEKQGIYTVGLLADDNSELKGKEIYGYTVMGGKNDLDFQKGKRVLVAIGDNSVRAKVTRYLVLNNFSLAEAAIHPSAQLARGVTVGTGSSIMAGSVINSDTMIGQNTIINTGANIDHDCVIGEAVHIAPSSTLCGGVTVGDLTLIGAGATVLPNVKIGRNVIVGAGSTVLKDIIDNVSVAGTPAEVIK
jgi:sugar O-acyltransferase (sialic acid O-acetyltransferase NeuD family)